MIRNEIPLLISNIQYFTSIDSPATEMSTVIAITYKKIDEWYIEWQRMTTSENGGTTSVQRVITNDNEWERVVLRVRMSGNEWYNEWQWMTTSDNEWQRATTSGITSDNKWQWVTTSDNKWQWVTVSDSSGTTNENHIVHFKEWMIAILSMTKTDTLLFQGTDACS